MIEEDHVKFALSYHFDAHDRVLIMFQSYDVRELAIRKAGKLADQNPAYVLPALRRHLQQLLTDLEHRFAHSVNSIALLGGWIWFKEGVSGKLLGKHWERLALTCSQLVGSV